MNRPKVLVADDEQVIRNLFERFLGKQGYSVSTAADGLSTLNEIEKNNYDMLILDLKMPKMEGIKALKAIRQLNKDLIIIIITGYATVDTAKEAIRQGCFDYITKPFNIKDVNIIIKRAFDMRRLVEEKRKLKEKLETAQRLASLAQMGAGVAHEVNTVLTSIKLFLEMLKPKLPELKKEGKDIDLILSEIERCEKLIVRFLSFAKPEKAEFFKTDINKIIKRSLRFFRYKLIKQKITVVTKQTKDMPAILCDPIQIEEVFLNIFSNSIDAMAGGGRLAVRSGVLGEKAVITIKDTGIGIPEEHMKKLYNPFFTTKPRGTGLGLSIVHRIISEHKGIVEIISEENKGTSVRIELPIRVKKI